jgi:hypothetical protein
MQEHGVAARRITGPAASLDASGILPHKITTVHDEERNPVARLEAKRLLDGYVVCACNALLSIRRRQMPRVLSWVIPRRRPGADAHYGKFHPLHPFHLDHVGVAPFEKDGSALFAPYLFEVWCPGRVFGGLGSHQ